MSGSRIFARSTVLLLALVVCNSAFAALVPEDKIPRFAIPKMSAPPAIDGIINPDEWREAAAVSGVANQSNNVLHPRPTTFFLAWDDTHLYVAYRVWIMPGYGKPRVRGRLPGSAGVREDGFEFIFHPRGANVAETQVNTAYKGVINCLGHGGDYARLAVGQVIRNWLPNFDTAFHIHETGAAPAGGTWFELEAAMPIEDFDLVDVNRAGDEWGLMLAFNHMSNTWMQARVPCNSGYFDTSMHSTGVLVEDTPAVKVLMEELPGASDGVASALFQAHNPTQRTVVLDVLAEFKAEDDELLTVNEKMTLAPGEPAQLRINQRLDTERLGDRSGSIYYRVTEGGRELHRYFTYFKTDYPEYFVKSEPRKEAFPLEVLFNPILSRISVSADSYYLDDPEAVSYVEYTVTRDADAGKIAHAVIKEPQTFYFKELRDLDELEPGIYTANVAMTLEEGTLLGPMEQKFEKLNEAEVFSEWWDNDIGDPERVIPPFEPMTREANTVSAWGRTYHLNALGLPQRIISQDGDVLASDARIIVKVNGKTQTVPISESPRFTEQKDWRYSFAGTARGAGLHFQTEGWVEQDGLIYILLTYEPVDAEPVNIEELRIEFPLSELSAESLVCVGPGANWSARTTTVLEKGKQGLLWSTLDTGRSGSMMRVGSFYPGVWVGGDRRGLLWWGDNDRGWLPHNDFPAHSVRREAGEVVLANHIISTPLSVEEPRTIEFSYMASPFRPLVKGWRATLRSRDGTFKGPHKGRGDVDGWSWLSPPSYNVDEWGDMWAEFKKTADEGIRRYQPFDPDRARSFRGSIMSHTSVPLIGWGPRTPDRKVYGYFEGSWPLSGTFDKSHSDYLLYICERAFREGGIRTIYWDIFFPTEVASLLAGLGYVLPNGEVQPSYFGFNLRRFMMRLYALNNDVGIAPGANVTHATNAYFLVAMPWIDALLDGEDHTLRDGTPYNWVDGWSAQHMRAMANSHNWGVHITWMDLIQLTDRTKAAQIRLGKFDYIRMFDSWGTHNYELLTDPFLQWGLAGEDVEFIPYWRNTYVEADDEEIWVSMWRKPDSVLLGIFNSNRRQAKNVSLKVNLDELNLVPKRPWQDFIRVHELDRDYLMKEQDVDGGNWRKTPTLDFYERTLKVQNILPHRGRFIAIRLY